jgi:large subunit ribosomal protein L25
MELQEFKVKARTMTGKGPARQARMRGDIPGVIYGGGEANVSLTVDYRSFVHLLHSRYGAHAVLKMDIEGNPESNTNTILKDIQYDPITGDPLHVDFQRIRLDEKIQTTVAIELEGQPEGVKEGGMLDHIMRTVDVECLALETPERFVLDVGHLNIGDSVTVAELTIPGNVTLLTDTELTVAAVHAPRVAEEEEEAAEEGEEMAEPEVIGEASEGGEGE